MVYVEEGGFVTPGQPICVAEEYYPGLNTKIFRDNIVISTKAGFVNYDRNKRIVNIKPVKPIKDINLGDRVLAEVKDVQEKIAIAEILAVNMKPLKHKRTAVILPNIKTKQDLTECIGVGDLVIAEVVTLFSGVIGLSIWKNELGSVLPICSKCGRPLRRKDKTLICFKCGSREKRKLAYIGVASLDKWLLSKGLPG